MSALGIYVDEEHCWMGNQKGSVYVLDHKGKMLRKYEMPDGVMALVGDAAWMYAGCNNGNVYDMTGEAPRLAYEIKKGVAIDWIDIRDGLLGVSNNDGKVTLIDPESQVLWTHKGKDGRWTIRIDEKRVYHGDDDWVVAYDRVTGKRVWAAKTGDILFGWQTGGSVFVGTADDTVVRLAKKDGKRECVYKCESSIPSCATTPDGERVFAGEANGNLDCFDAAGKRLWSLPTGCGTALSMQYHEGKVFIVTGSGVFACIDVSDAAIKKAKAGKVPRTRVLKAPRTKAIKVSRKVETTRSAGNGVVLECVRDGSKLRLHVVSRGYHKDWFVQFPRDIRVEGARYVVDEVREATQGGFYRALGKIRRLVGDNGRRR
jgi:outer membrane protein assembly factor BamB